MNGLTPPLSVSVKTLANLEPLLARELEELGAGDVRTGKRVVSCVSDWPTLYRMNLCLRTGLRVLVSVATFRIRNADELYRRAKSVAWEELFGADHTFAIDPNIRSAAFRHSHFAALRVKDAIADRFMELQGRRPNVHPEKPDILIHLHVSDEHVHISLDSSGRSLNQRGYRAAGGKAPLNEVLAAGMILHSGWDGKSPFYDPMTGSGTLCIEAAMIATNTPAQHRNLEFGFMRWPSYDEACWNQVLQECLDSRHSPASFIHASDADPRQLSLARRNAAEAMMSAYIRFSESDFFEVHPEEKNGIMMINPPYGERMEEEQIVHFYRRIGDAMKHYWSGFSAWVISSDIEALKRLGLRPFRKVELFNGTLRCVFAGFELYAGKKGHPGQSEAIKPAS